MIRRFAILCLAFAALGLNATAALAADRTPRPSHPLVSSTTHVRPGFGYCWCCQRSAR